jgi:hypothetical protein
MKGGLRSLGWLGNSARTLYFNRAQNMVEAQRIKTSCLCGILSSYQGWTSSAPVSTFYSTSILKRTGCENTWFQRAASTDLPMERLRTRNKPSIVIHSLSSLGPLWLEMAVLNARLPLAVLDWFLGAHYWCIPWTRIDWYSIDCGGRRTTCSDLHVVSAGNSQRNSRAVSECQEELNNVVILSWTTRRSRENHPLHLTKHLIL